MNNFKEIHKEIHSHIEALKSHGVFIGVFANKYDDIVDILLKVINDDDEQRVRMLDIPEKDCEGLLDVEYRTFRLFLDKYYDLTKAMSAIYNHGIDIFSTLGDMMFKNITTLMEKIMNEESLDFVFWYIEKQDGDYLDHKLKDLESTPPCESVSDLYNLIYIEKILI
jgi:hypothetical protein